MSSERQISVLVEIVYTLSGRGLAKDADLLSDAIRALGHDVSIRALPPQHPQLRYLAEKWGRAKKRLPSGHTVELVNFLQRRIRRLFSPGTTHAGLVIHLENVHPRYINTRCSNWLIPNQEWFRPERTHYLKDIDTVLCKTLAAKACFHSYHPNVEYLGFSAPVAMHRNGWALTEKNPGRILHVAGASPFKGTEAVLDAWKRNPQWPDLTVVANIPHLEGKISPNVELISNISDSELESLWREATIVVIPSEVEGYGQVLAEAMNYGAVVITTDAPPMNELVAADRGHLVPYSDNRRFRLGMRYKVSPESLELAINKALNEPDELRAKKAMNALNWARDNHDTFLQRLEHFLGSKALSRQNADQPAGQSQA